MDAWSHEYVLASNERALGRSMELLGAVRSGTLVKVSRGVYRHSWARATDPHRQPDDDYLARVRAAQLRAPNDLVVMGMSAAVAWGLPVVGQWPESVFVSARREDGGRSNAHLTRSYVGFPPPVERRDGLNVTTLARTVVDVARTESMERVVAIADAALRGQRAASGLAARRATTPKAIRRELDALIGAPGVARARATLGFANGLSASAGESCSRVGMWRLGLPAPILQQSFSDQQGRIGFVDFWWPEFRVVGEFDGRGKYLREEYARGRSTAEIVVDEKIREDRLRALNLRVVRWGWVDALNLRALERTLRGAGLR